MKSPIKTTLFSIILLMAAGCAKNSAQAEKPREDAEAKVRAEAAKKEMETLPKVFRTPNYLKKNEPAKSEPTTPAKATTPTK